MTKKKEKTLQKFTDFEKIKKPEDVQELYLKYPDSIEGLVDHLQELLKKSYNEKLGKEEESILLIEELSRILGKETNIRNYTYDVNHHLITTTIHNHLMDNGVFPTAQTIASKVGISRQTVHNHIKDGSFNKYNRLVKGRVEIMATSALEQLYKIGVQDRNSSALKSFIELSGAYKNTPNNVTNYIQINNLKLSFEDFNQLPEKALTRIEKIISKELEKESKLNLPIYKKDSAGILVIDENKI